MTKKTIRPVFSFILLSMICLSWSFYACSSDTESEEPSKPCTDSMCLDAKTLAVCDPTTGTLHAEICPQTCDPTINRCKDIPPITPCTSNICKDSATLLICNHDTGITQEMQCSTGCDQTLNRCNPSDTTNRCTSDRCQDDAFLLVCNAQTGTSEIKRCEYRCDKKANRCYDAPPKEKCTSDQCKDNSTLLACNLSTGDYVESKCENGCSNNACVQKETCTPQCKSNNEAIICHENDQASTEKCTNGCDTSTGKCRPESIIGEPCKTEADPVCEGNDFIYCAETSKGAVWTRMTCPDNYECKAYDGEVLCLESCSNAGENNTICGSGFIVKSICDTLDGKLYYLPDYDTGLLESCDNGCADRHVCME